MLRLRHGWLTDRIALLSLLLLCLVLKGIVLLRQPILARDGIYYIKFAYDLCPTDWRPSGESELGHVLSLLPAAEWPEVLKKHPYHPGYPLVIAGLAWFYHQFHPADLSPMEWQWCAHAASSVAGLLLVIPLFGLARSFLSIGAASTAVALFLILPATVQITTDTLAESWLLLFLLCALWCLVRAWRDPKLLWFALAGLFAGCGYLVRLEALLIPTAAALALVTQRWWTGTAMPWQPALRGGALLMALFLGVTTPYMLLIGKISNRPSVNQVVEVVADVFRGDVKHDPTVCYASRHQDGVNGQRVDAVRLLDAVRLVVTAQGKAGHYFLWPLAAVGAVVFWRTRRHDPACAVLNSVAVVHLALLLRLAYSAGYTSERHTLLLICLASVMAGIGLLHIIGAMTRQWPDQKRLPGLVCLGVGLGLALLCGPKAVQPLHAGQEGHRQAGLWLESKENRLFADTLIDPYLWTSFYAGKVTPWCSPKWDDVVFTHGLRFSPRVLGIVDPRDNDLNRTRDWRQAGVTGPGSVVVWSWPSAERPKLVIRQAAR